MWKFRGQESNPRHLSHSSGKETLKELRAGDFSNVVVGVPWWLNRLRIHCQAVAWVMTVAQVGSLAWELLHAMSVTKKKKSGESLFW